MAVDHQAIVINNFMGLFQRGDTESCPLDHFQDCVNIQFLSSRGFRTRDGLDTYLLYQNVVRIYTYVQQTKESLLVLNTSGQLFDTGSGTPFTPILTIATMADFGFLSYAGRAYITPNDGTIGLDNEFVYVYKGDGTPARKAAGDGPVSAPSAAVGATGTIEKGYHIFAVVYETDTGFLTKMGPGVALNVDPGAKKVNISSIPISPDSFVIKRHIVATKSISSKIWDGNLEGYQFFFIPDGEIDDNVTTTKTVDFYDQDLLLDASYLLDIFEEINAGAGLSTYHGRMVVYGEHDDISLLRFSKNGEPEAIDAVSGLAIFPLDGMPVQNGIEFRDIFYGFKRTKTATFVDNGDDPSSWPVEVIDNGIGCPLHGLATVLDSDGINIDMILIADLNGLMLFNGIFQRPELSYKIKDYWYALDRDNFNKIQMVNDTLSQVIYIVLPDGKILIADHGQGLDSKNIKIAPWTFDITVKAIALIDTTTLIIAGVAP